MRRHALRHDAILRHAGHALFIILLAARDARRCFRLFVTPLSRCFFAFACLLFRCHIFIIDATLMPSDAASAITPPAMPPPLLRAAFILHARYIIYYAYAADAAHAYAASFAFAA